MILRREEMWEHFEKLYNDKCKRIRSLLQERGLPKKWFPVVEMGIENLIWMVAGTETDLEQAMQDIDSARERASKAEMDARNKLSKAQDFERGVMKVLGLDIETVEHIYPDEEERREYLLRTVGYNCEKVCNHEVSY